MRGPAEPDLELVPLLDSVRGQAEPASVRVRVKERPLQASKHLERVGWEDSSAVPGEGWHRWYWNFEFP